MDLTPIISATSLALLGFFLCVRPMLEWDPFDSQMKIGVLAVARLANRRTKRARSPNDLVLSVEGGPTNLPWCSFLRWQFALSLNVQSPVERLNLKTLPR